MAFVQFTSVSLAFGDKDILKNASINLASGNKAALTGANGAGKSTLLRIMAGLVTADSGQRIAQKGCRIGYLPQSGLTHSGLTLAAEADTAFKWGYDMQARIDALGEEMARYASDKTADAAEEQAALITQLEDSGFHRRRQTAESVLMGLGFKREDMERRTEEFSGGWQMRIALAKVLLTGADILLLDEPTNYLDLEARTWLEGFLKTYQGGFLLVSHDRYFLDVTVNEVYELFGGSLRRYSGNFTHYEQVRAVELRTLMAEYDKQQAEKAHLEDFIRRFGTKATKAAQAQDRQKRLDKINAALIEIPESLKTIHFSFPPAPHSGRLVMRLLQVSKSYGERKVLNGLDLTVESGERVVASGPNGAGKSTLLRIIAGSDTDFVGERIVGQDVEVGYFSQNSAETIGGAMSALEFVEGNCPTDLVPKARDMLGAFLFRGDDVFKPLSVLSGGEKSRLALLRLLLRPVNLLVLDEPTNHLDMHSKDVLLDALKCFGGTVVFVSHDRGFIESLATRVLEMMPPRNGEGTAVRSFPGGYAYYAQRVADESEAQSEEAKRASLLNSSGGKKTEGASDAQKAREERKRADAKMRRAQKEAAMLEAEIEAAEVLKKEKESSLAEKDVYTNGEKCRAIQQEVAQINVKLDALNAQWEKIVMSGNL